MAGEQVTAPGQIQYGDLLLGPGTPYRWVSLTGWDETPAMDSGTVPRSSDHGAFPGALYAQARIVTVEGLAVHAEPGVVGTALAPLRAGTTPDSAVQLPLVVQLDDDAEPLLAWGRCIRRALPVVRSRRIGYLPGGALQFECADPRRYSLTERTAATSLPQPETGLVFPLVYPLPWGTPGSTGAVQAVNDGDATAHPTLEFRGPVAMPSLTNLSTGAVLEYDLALSATDVLTVDTWAGTVLLNGAADRLYTATNRSSPEAAFTLPPGATSLVFRFGAGSLSPAASATVRWRNAYW